MEEEKVRTRRHISRSTREAIDAVSAVVLLYVFLGLVGIGCPIRYVTGISCAGCGMTRAWLYLLRGDLQGAFVAHPLWWLVLPALLWIWRGRRLPRRAYWAGIWLIAGAFLVVYLWRMLCGDGSIVYFRPMDGLIGQIIFP